MTTAASSPQPQQPADTRLAVVIVDDHSIFRSGLQADLDPTFNIVGAAGNVDTAIDVIIDTQPDVVVLDVHLPGGNGNGGADVLDAIRDTAPHTRCLALSVSDTADDVVRVIRAGARGYITKSTSGAEVSDAIRRVAGGDAVFSPRLAGFVLDAFGAPHGETADADDELDRLSAREQEVLRLIARGYSYKEVASTLFIAPKTVESHVSAVLRKLQLSNRHELTRWALRRKLL